MLTLRRLFTTSFSACKQSGSSKRWVNRQNNDHFTNRAKGENLRSRAAFKLRELDSRFRLFRPGMTVVDLGFAPGSWSQVAAAGIRPKGRVIGVDMLFVQPPDGVTAIQGNFLDPAVQTEIRKILSHPTAGQFNPRFKEVFISEEEARLVRARREAEQKEVDEYAAERDAQGIAPATADLVLSDMCGMIPQLSGFWVRSVNDPYYRLANTTGIIARDHGASMDLCDAALIFCIESLRPGGNFVCKFYTGAEDRELESRILQVFETVKRVKPSASRQESREAYFVALNKRRDVAVSQVFPIS